MRILAHTSLRIGAVALLAGCQSIQPALQNAAESRASASSSGYSTVFSFNGTDGADPVAALVVANGVLYGTTPIGGKYDHGTVFSLSPSGTETVVHNFKGSPHDGAYPTAALTFANGALFGVTQHGGPYGFKSSSCSGGCGTFFEIAPNGKTHTLYDFSPGSGDGQTVFPNTTLAFLNGALYGTSVINVYTASTSGGVRSLYHFQRLPDGNLAQGALLPLNGVLYGTTSWGGSNKHYGTVYSVTTSGQENVVYSFTDVPDGRKPMAGLTDLNGTLYGTTEYGGSGPCRIRIDGHLIHGCGTVFGVTTSGAESVLYSFQGKADGAYPLAGLIAVNGALYGTTSSEGAHHAGTLFLLTPSGTESVLHSFGSGTDGAKPMADLADVNGILYGTTASGGAFGDGTVYALRP